MGMPYHQLDNLGEIIQGDLVSKPSKEDCIKYFLNCGCNCNSNTKVNGVCTYEDK